MREHLAAMDRDYERTSIEFECCSESLHRNRDLNSTRRILAVAAAPADPHSCRWRWRCCCCCVPARLGVERKLDVPTNGRKYKHPSGINMKMKIYLYAHVLPSTHQPTATVACVIYGQTPTLARTYHDHTRIHHDHTR